ncbi:MAG: glycoside hydrolase family 3 C-terminal domain-containing protein, partial [Bacilli bacterium]|nr:glycoside hydrolase family 3 C-terminal domain-containing protein [Bacilli bacterium]
MKKRLLNALSLGLAATFASVMVISIGGSAIANDYRTNIDNMFGTKSYEIVEGDDSAKFQKKYSTVDEMIEAARKVAVKEGQEGTVVMKNDNSVLPISSSTKVALFGVGAYATFPYLSGDLKAGNADAVDLKAAFVNAGYTVDPTVAGVYEKITNKHIGEVVNPWTGQISYATQYDMAPVAAPGDMTNYQINEVPAADLATKAGVASTWSSGIDAGVGIVVISRGAGEGNTYSPTLPALDYEGKATTRNALQLSEAELSVIDLAKSSCGKVVVLINSGNNLELGDISKGGAHEADGIAYIGCINDYQLTGVVDVLVGNVNANGHLADTFVANNLAIPASVNMGSGMFSDKDIIAANATNGFDARFPNTEIGTQVNSSFASGVSYSADSYIVEAEGIYVGYKYFETRYFDSIANTGFKADSTAGSTDGQGWSYSKEVLYPFGFGISYLDYEQEITRIEVDKSLEGNITADIEIKNKGDKTGLFTAQLYAQQPYTDYDKTNLVEKSAVMFLNSAKVSVDGGASKTVTITVPTKYLASWDNKAGTYNLEEGDYYFTAANGSHAAVNNFLGALGKEATVGTSDNGTMKWSSASNDVTTFSKGYNNYSIVAQADNADINYWLPGKVTYMTRQNWETFPVDYTDSSRAFKLG